MTLKNIILSGAVKKTILGVGIAAASMILGKAMYDYTIYSNLKYIKKKLKNITIDEV